MSDVELLKKKAAALRAELTAIEAAIAVFERHAGKGDMDWTRLLSPSEQTTAPISPTFGVDEILAWIRKQTAPVNCRTAMIGLLRHRPEGMSKQELRDGLEKMGVNVEDSTVTWTLSNYTDTFDNFSRGMYKLKPGNHL